MNSERVMFTLMTQNLLTKNENNILIIIFGTLSNTFPTSIFVQWGIIFLEWISNDHAGGNTNNKKRLNIKHMDQVSTYIEYS